MVLSNARIHAFFTVQQAIHSHFPEVNFSHTRLVHFKLGHNLFPYHILLHIKFEHPSSMFSPGTMKSNACQDTQLSHIASNLLNACSLSPSKSRLGCFHSFRTQLKPGCVPSIQPILHRNSAKTLVVPLAMAQHGVWCMPIHHHTTSIVLRV